MPKKPAAVNAFALFVNEMRRSYAFEGNPYTYFGDTWSKLPASEKEKYTGMAKELKLKKMSDLESKFTTSGQSYAEVERIKQEKEDKLMEMNKTIEGIIATLEMKGELGYCPFFLMHVNYFCASDQGVYYPAEVGLVKFSLANGLEDFYHKILDPGQFPTGSFRDAMEYSKKTHNLPCPPDRKNSERDFNKIDREIKEFLLGKEGFVEAVRMYRQTNKPITLPPIYTYYSREMFHFNKDNDLVVRSFLENLPDGTREKYTIRVYELTKLLYELRNACAREKRRKLGLPPLIPGQDKTGLPSVIAAQAELERDIFSLSAGLACPFHEDGDYVQHCSLSLAKRWGYVLSEFCCNDLGILLVPGQHCPIKVIPFQSIEQPVRLQEPMVTRNVPPSTPPVTAAEVTKKRVPIKEPLKELRQPQASCVDALASQFSEKLKTSDKTAGSVMGASKGVAGTTPMMGAGRGAAIAKKLGVVTTESIAAAGRGRRPPDTPAN